jgi:hypothetical protein
MRENMRGFLTFPRTHDEILCCVSPSGILDAGRRTQCNMQTKRNLAFAIYAAVVLGAAVPIAETVQAALLRKQK